MNKASLLRRTYFIQQTLKKIESSLKRILMSSYYAVEDFEKARDMASLVLQSQNLKERIRCDALLIVARSSIELQDTIATIESYGELESSQFADIAAEAFYYRAKRNFLNGELENTMEILNQLSSLKGHKGKWSPRALLLLSKVYIQLEDPFQANFILESIVENYGQYPDLIDQANQMLNTINQSIEQ